MADVKEVAEVVKNASTRIKFGTTEYRGSIYVDMREHLVSADGSGYSGPTKKGIRFHRDLLDQMIEGLQKVKKDLESTGTAK